MEKIPGIFRVYPLLDNNGVCLWPAKFPSEKSVWRVRKQLSSDVWALEYLLTLNSVEYEYAEPCEPPGLQERDDKVALNYFHYRYATLNKEYQDVLTSIILQKALIPQMREYQIAIPTTGSRVMSEYGDPQYEKYQEYKRKEEEIVDEFHKNLKRALRVRSRERARREGELVD